MAQLEENAVFKGGKVISRTPVKGIYKDREVKNVEKQIDLYKIMDMVREIKRDIKKITKNRTNRSNS